MVKKHIKITDYKEIERANTTPTEVPKETELVSASIDENDKRKLEKKKEVEKEEVGDTLTPRQMKFVELYTGDMLGNGVQCYLEVYDIDTNKPGWYKTACVCSSKLLSNAKVYTKINEMLEEVGLNDQFVDKQLLFLVSQQDDKGNKLGAIREYNKLKSRITDKIEKHGVSEEAKAEVYKKLGEKIDTMSADDVNKSLQDLLNS